MEKGLAQRATELRDLAERLISGDTEALKAIKTAAHKLRGIAGTYGHQDLTDLAKELEQKTSVSTKEEIISLAHQLASAALEISHREAAAQSGEEAAKTMPQPSPGAPSTEYRILAIDDDSQTRELLDLTLRRLGKFNATILSSAQKALELLQNEPFDLVLVDAMMPDMDGRKFIHALKATGGEAANVTIAILSAASAEELGWQELHQWSVNWMSKPFRPQQLVEEIRKLLERI